MAGLLCGEPFEVAAAGVCGSEVVAVMSSRAEVKVFVESKGPLSPALSVRVAAGGGSRLGVRGDLG